MPKKSKLQRNRRPNALAVGSVGGNQELIACDAKRLRAFEMYVDEHRSVPSIAEELKVDRTTVYKWITHQHERILAGVSKMAAVVRHQQDSQIDELLERWMPLAVHEELKVQGIKYNSKGERTVIELDTWDAGTKASEIVLKAMALKAKNHGLHTVEIKRPEGPARGMEEIMDLVIPSLRRLMIKDKPVIEAEIVS
jgi:predicted DNA-binding protein YlxM (UPF0122 family)